MKSYERNGELLLFADGPHVAGKLRLQPWAPSLQRETFNMDAPGSQQPTDAESDRTDKSERGACRYRRRSGFATSTCATAEAATVNYAKSGNARSNSGKTGPNNGCGADRQNT